MISGIKASTLLQEVYKYLQHSKVELKRICAQLSDNFSPEYDSSTKFYNQSTSNNFTYPKIFLSHITRYSNGVLYASMYRMNQMFVINPA